MQGRIMQAQRITTIGTTRPIPPNRRSCGVALADVLRICTSSYDYIMYVKIWGKPSVEFDTVAQR